jgi:hypothetical protein
VAENLHRQLRFDPPFANELIQRIHKRPSDTVTCLSVPILSHISSSYAQPRNKIFLPASAVQLVKRRAVGRHDAYSTRTLLTSQK